MANQIVCVLAETYRLRIFAIMLPSSDFSVAHCSSYGSIHSGMLYCRKEETLSDSHYWHVQGKF